MLKRDTQAHTHTHTDTRTHTRRPNRVNPLKSPFRKFDPRTVLSLLIGKRK